MPVLGGSVVQSANAAVQYDEKARHAVALHRDDIAWLQRRYLQVVTVSVLGDTRLRA